MNNDNNSYLWLNSLIRPINGTLTGTTTSGQSGTGSNANEGYSPMLVTVLHCGLSSVTNTYISSSLVYQPPLCPRWVIPQMRKDTIYLEHFLTVMWFVGTSCLWIGSSRKDKKNCPLTIGCVLLSNPKNVYFYCGFPWEQTFPIG